MFDYSHFNNYFSNYKSDFDHLRSEYNDFKVL